MLAYMLYNIFHLLVCINSCANSLNTLNNANTVISQSNISSKA